MRKIAIFDIDNTLLRYDQGFNHFMESKGHSLSSKDNYDLLSQYPSVGCEVKMLNFILQFNSSPDFGILEPNPDMIEWVEFLKDNGYEVVALSCFVPEEDDESLSISAEASRKYRRENLDSVFGHVFDQYIFLTLGHSKLDIFKTLAIVSSELVIVDDATKYIYEAISVAEKFSSVNVIVYDQPYNREITEGIYGRLMPTKTAPKYLMRF